jgi:hypothetical protein
MTNQEFADSLRLVADFYEENPEMFLPEGTLKIFSTYGKEDVIKAAKMLGTCEKQIDEDFYKLRRKFGSITLEVIETRSLVCTKRTVMKEMPVDEWDCPESLLESKEEPKDSIGE